MRRTVLPLAFLLSSTFSTNAQETVGGIPFGLRMGWPLSNLPTVLATPFDTEGVALDDAARDAAGRLPLYGRMQTIHVDPMNTGEWTSLPNGDGVWRLRIVSPGALAMELFGGAFELPENAVLHVYSEDGEQVVGGYTAFNRQPDGGFSTHMVFGETCIVEYYEPAPVRGQGWFHLDRLAHAYRMVGQDQAAMVCMVDVNCTEGTNWQQQRDAVVRIRVVIPQGTGWCTGTLVNNTAQDCKPYILSAFHCGDESTAANFGQYQFRFRYERSGCGSGTVPGATGNTITGCVKRADSNDINVQGNITGSDFLLLELNNAVPVSYNAYYAGWNVGTNPSTSGVSIHHPGGDTKKVSTYTNALTNSGWGSNNTHWRVVWVETANGHSVTQGGSSGSPIFDPGKRIVGTLTGGSSCCTVNGCGPSTAPYTPDYYGKMSHHWTLNSNAANQKLKVWLDPLNNNVTVFDGSADPCQITGVEERAAMAPPAVYPNPADDRIMVRFPEGTSLVDRLEVTDLSGRIVHAARPVALGQAAIDVDRWSAGTYMVTLYANGARLGTARFVVAGR